jgi:DNA-binding response OmpR family regulator
MAKILIVEDDEVIGRAVAEHLRHAGFDPLLVLRGGRERACTPFHAVAADAAAPATPRGRHLGEASVACW